MIGPSSAFIPYIKDPGLFITVGTGDVTSPGGVTRIPSGAVSLAANTTTYVFVNTSALAVQSNTSGFPTTNTVPVAIVTTSNDGIVTMLDVRADVDTEVESGGGGAATQLATSGAPVTINATAPSHTGQLLVSQPGNVTASWVDPQVQGLYPDGSSVASPPAYTVPTTICPVSVGGKGVDGNLHTLSTDNSGVLNVNATVTPPANQTVNLTQVGGAAITEGQKTSAASLPVVVASDQSAIPISAASLPLPAGAATSGNQTTANTSLASIDGKLTSPITVTGTVTTTPPANASTNVTQFGGVNVSTGTGASGTGIPRVTISNDSSLAANQSVNVNQIGGSAITEGQKTSATSVPVVIASDQSAVAVSGTITAASTDSAPATQNITAQDIGSAETSFGSQFFITGAPTAGSAASFALASGYDTVRIQVTGTWTGSLEANTSTDGGTTWTFENITLAGITNTATSSTFTTNFIGYGNIGGVTNFRIRSISPWTGTATVKAVFSVNSSCVSINPESQLSVTFLGLQDVGILGGSGGVLDAAGAGTGTGANIWPGNELIVGGVNDPTGAKACWPLTMDSAGRLITTGAGGTFPATQSGTWTDRVVGNAGGVFDAANVAAAPANVLQVGGRFTTAPTTLTTGQAASLNLDSAQNLLTKVNVALPTGANTIGAVTQASGPWTTNVTQWASTTLGVPTNFGTTPTAVIAASVNASMFSGTTALGTPNTFGTTAPTGAALGTNASLFVGTTLVRTNQTTTATGAVDVNNVGVAGTTMVAAAAGIQKVGISGATAATLDAVTTAATSPANGIAVLGRYNTANPALTNGQTAAIQVDSAGTAFVRPYRRSQYKATPVTITASTTPVTAVAAQGANIFADITGFFVTVTAAATTATAFTITLSDGTVSYVFDLDTGALATSSADPTILSLPFPSPLPATTANTAWTATSSSATPTMHIVTTFIVNIAN